MAPTWQRVQLLGRFAHFTAFSTFYGEPDGASWNLVPRPQTHAGSTDRPSGVLRLQWRSRRSPFRSSGSASRWPLGGGRSTGHDGHRDAGRHGRRKQVRHCTRGQPLRSGHVELRPSRWKQTETTDQTSRCRATHPAGAHRPSAEMKLRGRSGRSASEGTSASLSRPGIDGEQVAGVTSAVGNNINARGCGRGALPAGTPWDFPRTTLN